MSEQGGTFMQMIGGVASEKCSSCQLVDLMMIEVWFGVHRLMSGVSQTQTPGRKRPSCPVLGENPQFFFFDASP